MAQSMYPNEPIVVVGSGCRFPGDANTPSKLWELLQHPRDVQSRIPKERFDVDTFYHPDGKHHGRTNAPYAYVLQDDLGAFDAAFFNIQAGEAESMDPRHRLLLETVYEAVTNAGMRIQDLQGTSTAVYVGVMTHDYETVSTRDLESIPTYSATGVAVSVASNRISYFFDWHGPSMTIDTACSSSLVAVHLAVQQLRTGQSSMAIAAGANLILGPMTFVLESKLSMLSPSGRSRMWDAGADGYARGEAVCSVVLKTLSQALRDGDTIECVIRETGVNQDGRTTGITMPNHSAQEALIKATYAQAGLDITKAEDRCQFFEAHGTGTPAGDPQEAEAIATAFFGHEQVARSDGNKRAPLFVGSAKTVVGHTEGTAGLAGLMKASFAVRHGVIPPNLLFDKISPRVAPFYKNLRIPTEATQWPALPPGQPRRASVNSFGFGGTNAHAIIEEYMEPEQKQLRVSNNEDCPPMTGVLSLPLVLSAKSQRSLKIMMEEMLQFLESHPEIHLHDLTWSLLRKRSVLPFRRAIVGHSHETIRRALEDAIEDGIVSSDFTTEVRGQPSVLGIFTGQGAQWPGMLKNLIESSPYVRSIVRELDDSLQSLPEKYRPSWTLLDQFMLEGEASNVQYATFSQPLCCAVQIVLVRLLEAARIRFTAVVGHSSGEIACAFAAGLISASLAIRIAYLRGVVSAGGARGTPGAMLAAGMSFEEAQEICELDAFEGRICVAASNSPDSVTFSGNANAIDHLKGMLEDESTFARLLKVDTAYHSHHMLPCADPYMQALEECGCAVADAGSPAGSVPWYSSVDAENRQMAARDVTAKYWKDNLVSPVLFSHAVQRAVVTHKALDIGIEVGCHPALKSPCVATIKDVLSGVDLAYTGCLERGKNDLDSFSRALAYLWERFGASSFDADEFMRAVTPDRPCMSVSKLLPAYPWDRSRRYWVESRATRHHLRGPKPHLLLGKLSEYSTPLSFQWLNFVRPRDIEWLDGHALQGQTVFPAAGYIVMAMEAALMIAGTHAKQVKLLEILDMSIDKAVIFDDEDSLVELNLTADVSRNAGEAGSMTISFKIDSCLSKEGNLSLSAKGQLALMIGDVNSRTTSASDQHHLPPPEEEHPHMNRVNIKAFYHELGLMGYNYSKHFRRLHNMQRADLRASGTIDFIPLMDEGNGCPLLLHPASLDVTFQTVIGAYSSPGDRRLRCLYVPTHVDRITLVPSLCLATAESGCEKVAFNTINTYDKGDYLSGDIAVFDAEQTTLFQVENITFKPFSPPDASTDHAMFARWSWGPLTPDSLLDNPEYWATAQDKEAIPIIERIVYFYIRSFLNQLTLEERQKAAFHLQKQIEWLEQVLASANEGRHLWYDPGWENDTEAQIEHLCTANSYHPHVRLVQRVGQHLLPTVRSNGNPFDLLDHDGLLTEFYTNTLSFGPALHYARELVAQIAHRYQSMDILEIGAGTGGATKYVLATPQLGFNSYTYTDISTGFFEQAREQFAPFEDRMVFEPLDIRRSPAEQGFETHAYDLIIASNVLHATPDLEKTMAHARSLLKPGGQMVILEITHKEHTRLGFIFGLFADWWAGVDDGRCTEPFVSFDRWDAILKRVGFSGVDSRTTDRDANLFPTSVFSTHAIDATVEYLDAPLASSRTVKDSYPPLVVVGGQTKSQRLLNDIKAIMPPRPLQTYKRLVDLLDAEELPMKSTFVMLTELDEELFAGLTEETFEATKLLLTYSSNTVWLTENAWVQHPHQASTIGMLRSIRREHPDLGVHVLDVDAVETFDATFLVEQVLRLEEHTDELASSTTWTQEPEVSWCKGRPWIPRLKRDLARNNRMNSSRRPIYEMIDSSRAPVALQTAPDSSSYFLESAETWFVPESVRQMETKTVYVHFSCPHALRVGQLGFFFLVQGHVQEGNREVPVVALAERNASIVHVRLDYIYTEADNNLSEGGGSLIVTVLAAAVLAETVISTAKSLGVTDSILVLNPPSICGQMLLHAGEEIGLQVHLATTSGNRGSVSAGDAKSWLTLHARDTDWHLRRVLPRGVQAFVDLSADQSCEGLTQRMMKVLMPGCAHYRAADLFTDTVSTELHRGLRHQASLPAAYWEHVVSLARQGLSSVSEGWEVMPCTQFAAHADKTRPDLSTVISWPRESDKATLPTRIRSIDAETLFAADKTYLLVGLTGDLGRSLGRWMVQHGACHIVLTSRNPQVNPKWLAHVEELGGRVTVLSMDVTSQNSVEAGLAKLKDLHLPPVGGIAFGPLVLQDVMLKNMELPMMEMVLNPKVEGVRILHEKFSDPTSSDPLDFFVMFSSIVAVMGNPGQANYSAANCYLQALAQQRVASGLAASTIDIGAVYGVGFVTRAELEEDFNAIRFMFDSVEEHELHTLFAEAVVAGRRAVHQQEQQRKFATVLDMADLELTTGIPPLDPALKDRITFFDDPRIGNLKIPEYRGAKAGEGAAGSKGSVKEQLLQATNLDQVRQIVIDGLSAKLQVTLQIPDGESVHPTIPLIDQGVDSLGAVTVGTWFSKQLYLDLPLLKVLGGASIADLADEAAARLPPSSIPLVAATDGGAESTDNTSENEVSGREDTDLSAAATITEPSSADEDDTEPGDEDVPRSHHPLSLGQEYSWRIQQGAEDPTVFNNTIGMFMKGSIDLKRLYKALRAVLRRHEIFRTGFANVDENGMAQLVFGQTKNKVQTIQVSDRASAEEGYRQLVQTRYNTAAGDTLRLVDFFWGQDDHLLVVAYHRLVGDGSTTENIFVEAGQLYDGTSLSPHVPQFADLAARQRAMLEDGRMEEDLAYWKEMHYRPSSIPVLPLMRPLVGNSSRSDTPNFQHCGPWQQHEAVARLDPMVAFRIKERSRKHKATPMQFYLAAYQVLLARLTDSTDLTVGLADTNRATVDEMAAMGFFANLLPLRFRDFRPHITFGEHLIATRDLVREALQHARVPYGVLLDQLGLQAPVPTSNQPAPLFQAVFDYKQGQAESGTIGGAKITEVIATRERTPYDVVLEMSDDPTKDPLLTAKLQSSRYEAYHPQAFLESYMSLLSMFSMNPALKLA
ncbi:hypothetical protein ATERTT37_000016 [Aspergillus terreus]